MPPHNGGLQIRHVLIHLITACRDSARQGVQNTHHWSGRAATRMDWAKRDCKWEKRSTGIEAFSSFPLFPFLFLLFLSFPLSLSLYLLSFSVPFCTEGPLPHIGSLSTMFQIQIQIQQMSLEEERCELPGIGVARGCSGCTCTPRAVEKNFQA